jgi:hypothetical protein
LNNKGLFGVWASGGVWKFGYMRLRVESKKPYQGKVIPVLGI